MPPVGDVRVSLAEMDREVREQYQLVIQAKDMEGQLGGLAGTTTVNITLSDVNDNPPKFTQSKTITGYNTVGDFTRQCLHCLILQAVYLGALGNILRLSYYFASENEKEGIFN